MSGLDPGSIRIRLSARNGAAGAVQVCNQRPKVTSVLRGKNADEAVRAVPLLFSVCGCAQGRAAALALRAARGQDSNVAADADVHREVVREHLWRLMLDLPPLLELSPPRELFVTTQHALAHDDRARLATLLKHSFWALLAERLQALPSLQVDRPCLLPGMSAAKSLEHWSRLNQDVAQLPTWHARPALTGAWARRPDSANDKLHVAALWEARLAEVSQWTSGAGGVDAGGTVSAASVAPGVGRSLVDTARGVLMHEITLDGERIGEYVIVAPTEWNFHPHGLLNDIVAQHCPAGPDDLRAELTQWITALDPCVDWRLEFDSDSPPNG